MLVKWGKNRGRAVAGNFWRKGGRLPCLALPFFWLLLLCIWGALQGIDARGIYEQIVVVAEGIILHTKRPIHEPMNAKSHANIRSHHVYTIVVHSANYLCYSWVYVVFGAGGEATSLPLYRLLAVCISWWSSRIAYAHHAAIILILRLDCFLILHWCEPSSIFISFFLASLCIIGNQCIAFGRLVCPIAS